MKANLLLIALVLMGLSLAHYSNDLTQENPETLFLTSSGIKEYQAFKKLVPEKKLIIFKFNTAKELSNQAYEELELKLAPTFSKYSEDFDFLTAKDLFTSRNKLKRAINENKFSPKQINLLSSKFVAFLAIEKKAGTRFHTLIDDMKKISPLRLQIAGIPYTNYLLDNYSRSIKEKVFPLMFAVSFLFILLITKNLLISIFLFLPCLFSAVICLSFIKYFYSTMNMVTSIVPLMCFTITLAMVFHLFFMMRKTNSFKEALIKKLPPIVLMVITTCIGFGSLMISDIAAISTFGKLSLFLILITAIYALLFMYASERFLISDTKHAHDFSHFKKYFSHSFSLKTIIIIAILSLSIGAFFLGKIEIITDATRYFPMDSGLKQSIDSVNQSVTGIPLYDIIIDSKEDSIENLRQIDILETDLSKEIQELKGFKGIVSLNSMIKSANKEYSGDERLPEQLIAFQVLRSKLKPSIKASYPLGKSYKLSIVGKAINVDDYEVGLKKIDDFFVKRNVSYKLNGLYYNLMISQKSMISILFKSFLIALFIVSTIALLYLRKSRIFFIFLFVNIVPVFASFTLMYLFDFSINIATVMTYSIALGMIVDSSFHLIHNLSLRESTGFDEYFNTTVLPIIGSSILLIGSFSLFGFNSFLPIKQFGLNLSIILFIGLVFDLFILPTLFLGSNKIKEAFHDSNL